MNQLQLLGEGLTVIDLGQVDTDNTTKTDEGKRNQLQNYKQLKIVMTAEQW